MNILANKSTTNGSQINGECVMIDKYENVYNCIDNAYHPNPGTAADSYSEIERTVDWLFEHDIHTALDYLYKWVYARVAHQLSEDIDATFEDVLYDVMFCDAYTPCADTINAVREAYITLRSDADMIERWANIDDTYYAAKITDYLNETFLRVRAGGKLNPQGTNSIYFRISSHGYDWRSVIEDFLWDTFGSPENMPKYVWIGHDEETNPPEVTLYEGSPEDFLEYDHKIVASKLM